MASIHPQQSAASNETNMALSVTRHVQNPLEGFERLLYGLDSLDLGIYIKWSDSHFRRLLNNLEKLKSQAQGKEGFLDKTRSGRTFMHLPSGKAPNYRYQLKFPEYRIYISITNPPVNSPNVYISIGSKSLWENGVTQTLELILQDLKEFGGEILEVQPSRCDISADYYIPNGITLPFLKEHMVSRSRKTSQFEGSGVLETFYVGTKGAPIQLRIYDKGKEIGKSGKFWFLEHWGRAGPKDIWRVEFQLRRTALKEFKIETFDDLMERLGGIWLNLTNGWFSLRLPDNSKTERRTIHPWWVNVQSVSEELGPSLVISREQSKPNLMSIQKYVSHVAGCLPAVAAYLGITDIKLAVRFMGAMTLEHWGAKNFEDAYNKKALLLETMIEEETELNKFDEILEGYDDIDPQQELQLF